jgi:aspartyl protease family protein
MPAFVVAIAVAVGLLVLLFNLFPEQRFSNLESSQLVYMAGVLVLVLSSVLIRFRSNFSSSVKSLATWCVILVVLVSAYSYRNEFDSLLGRIHAQLVPSSPVESQAGEVSFRPQGRGGFVVDAEVNGVPLRFVVDTGADIVTLTEADAERLGFNIEELNFREPFISPGGEGMAAKVLLDEIKIGSIVKHNVVAHIVRGSLDVSLLGMNYIGRIDRVTLTPDGLTFVDSET